MKVVFLGTASFGIPALEAILSDSHHQLVAVVTGPDRVRGRGRAESPTPVACWASEHGLTPVFKPESLREPRFVEEMRGLEADVFVVVAYRILPEAVYSIPRWAFNLHASLLPAYRGAAPVQRAIMAGETETGVTTFLLRKSVDTGAILGQRPVPIRPAETAAELTDRLADVGSALVMETLNRLERGADAGIEQDDTKASSAPKIGPADRRLDFDRPARDLINHVRAMSPRPGCSATCAGRPVKILALLDDGADTSGVAPGTIVVADPKLGLIVAAQDRLLRLERIQPSGKKVQSGAEFVRGYHIRTGDRFDPV